MQSFILSPGERFDFLVECNQEPGSYWILAETLEIITSGPAHIGEAILEYAENPLSGTDYDNDVCLNFITMTHICLTNLLHIVH